jgi:hypothetical protein
MSDENNTHGESKIIFEDENWLIVEPLDSKSYFYYAPEKMKSEWGEFQGGDVYFVIYKLFPPQDGLKTYTVFTDGEENSLFWWNGRVVKKKKNFFEEFPDYIKEQISKLLTPSRVYDLLSRLASGEDIPSRIIENSDTLIESVRIVKSNPRKSMVYIEFDDLDSFFDIFKLNDDDRWFYRAMNSYYDSYDFYDSSWGYEEWREGYLVRWFNNENTQKFKEIVNLLFPEYNDLSDDEKVSEVCKKLDDMFDEISEIYEEYVTELNYCKNRAGEDMVKDELCGVFDTYGLVEKVCTRSYVTAVNILLLMYREVNDNTLTLSELFSELVSNQDFGGWYDYMYDIECVDFDDESFQRTVERCLEEIYDKIEDSEEFINVSEYSRIIQQITTEYPIDTNSKTKYGKKFKVIKINPKDNKIHIAVDTGGGMGEKRSYTEEEFNNFLVSPELFENKKIFKKSLNN